MNASASDLLEQLRTIEGPSVRKACPREAANLRAAWRLAAARESVGWSKRALSDHLGVDRQTLRRWETGAERFGPWVIERLPKEIKIAFVTSLVQEVA